MGCIVNKRLFLSIFFLILVACPSIHAASLAECFQQAGYVEFSDKYHGAKAFDALYAYFDDFIEFLQTNPSWAQKLYAAKERFIRSKERKIYSTDVFGFYDESRIERRNQISFYYSTHFHEFIYARYPEFKNIAEITRFLDACLEIQKPYCNLFIDAATELGLETIFFSQPSPILFKVIKYFPYYTAAKPHYDGAAFSLFLDSTDNQALHMASYKSSLTADDFSPPRREYLRESQQNSILLIPGAFLTEFSIYPTPHIVRPSVNVRYAAVAFAMRSDYILPKLELSPLPVFNY